MLITRPAEAVPMTEMNTTPLIDVMLVLLVMLIITVPIQGHAVKVDLPTGPAPAEVRSDRNRLVITQAGNVLWNGRPVTRQALQASLEQSAQLDPGPELQLQPEPLAPYRTVDEVLAMTKRAQVTRVGFVGNEAYQTF